jgi:hypothetical protein
MNHLKNPISAKFKDGVHIRSKDAAKMLKFSPAYFTGHIRKGYRLNAYRDGNGMFFNRDDIDQLKEMIQKDRTPSGRIRRMHLPFAARNATRSVPTTPTRKATRNSTPASYTNSVEVVCDLAMVKQLINEGIPVRLTVKITEKNSIQLK